MKYYSDVLKRTYETEKECLEAEKTYEVELAKAKALEEKKNADRKVLAEKVEAARKKALEANKEYKDLLSEFCNKYGAFHQSLKVNDVDELFNWFFRI